MGGRYYITGVQLGILKANTKSLVIQTLVDEVIDKQFIGKAIDLKELQNGVMVSHGLTSHKICFLCTEVHQFGTAKMIFDKLEKNIHSGTSYPDGQKLITFDRKYFEEIKKKWLKVEE